MSIKQRAHKRAADEESVYLVRGGRLLRRLKGSENVMTYWLGLNKIAEEEATTSTLIFRPDTEASGSPSTNGWYEVTGSDTMNYATDASVTPRGNVLHLAGTHFFGKGAFVIGNDQGDTNPNDDPFDTANDKLGVWIKNAQTTGTITLEVVVEDGDGNENYMLFYSDNGTDSGGGGFYEYYLGTSLNDGEWHYVELDLQARLDQFSGPAIANVTTVAFFAQDLFVDDMILSEGLLGKSYQLRPGAQIEAYLGTQSGSSGGTSQGAWAKWYHQYNDLGTVQTVTDAVGAKIAVGEPDFYGNYRYASGTMPDAMGLTSKFLDSDAGLYYFNARWYDPERGHWIGKDPLGYSTGINLYLFNHGDPVHEVDPSGLVPGWVWIAIGIIGGIAAARAYCCYEEAHYGYGTLPGWCKFLLSYTDKGTCTGSTLPPPPPPPPPPCKKTPVSIMPSPPTR